MTDIGKWRPIIATLSSQAADGSITVDDFYRTWPQELDGSSLARSIYEDLEDGVQHFPAKLLSGKPDYESWRASESYRRILIDIEILKIDASESRLAEIRNRLLTERDVRTRYTRTGDVVQRMT